MPLPRAVRRAAWRCKARLVSSLFRHRFISPSAPSTHSPGPLMSPRTRRVPRLDSTRPRAGDGPPAAADLTPACTSSAVVVDVDVAFRRWQGDGGPVFRLCRWERLIKRKGRHDARAGASAPRMRSAWPIHRAVAFRIRVAHLSLCARRHAAIYSPGCPTGTGARVHIFRRSQSIRILVTAVVVVCLLDWTVSPRAPIASESGRIPSSKLISLARCSLPSGPAEARLL